MKTPKEALLEFAAQIEALANSDFGDSSVSNRPDNYEFIADANRLALTIVCNEAQKAVDAIVAHAANNLGDDIVDVIEPQDALTSACEDWILPAIKTGEDVYDQYAA